MWNARQAKSLASAVLITAMIQGALVWKFNEIATQDASRLAQPATGSLAATAKPARTETRHVTLAPVVVVGRSQTSKTDPAMTVANTTIPAGRT